MVENRIGNIGREKYVKDILRQNISKIDKVWCDHIVLLKKRIRI